MKKIFITLNILIVLLILKLNIQAQDIDWYSLKIFMEAPFIPNNDNSDNEWYEIDFDDIYWSPIYLPDYNWNCTDCDRFYRGYFKALDDNLNLNDYYLKIKSDDGIWIYINGIYVGHWGGDIHQGGKVNIILPDDIPGDSYKADPIYITDKLVSGKNVIAIHVSEHKGIEYFELSLFIKPKRN